MFESYLLGIDVLNLCKQTMDLDRTCSSLTTGNYIRRTAIVLINISMPVKSGPGLGRFRPGDQVSGVQTRRYQYTDHTAANRTVIQDNIQKTLSMFFDLGLQALGVVQHKRNR